MGGCTHESLFICGLISGVHKSARQEFAFRALINGKAGEEVITVGLG
jgi:hypothetical protein